MKDQRWPGDQESIGMEFTNARMQEAMGLAEVERSKGNDYLALGNTRQLDAYEVGELEPSYCTQLDTVGMQPHAREYLERDLTAMRSGRKFSMVAGQVMEHCDGIQFSGTP